MKYIATREGVEIIESNAPATEKQKVLIVDEYKKYGLGSYGTSANGHRKNKFSQEYIAIQKEMKRIGLGK